MSEQNNTAVAKTAANTPAPATQRPNSGMVKAQTAMHEVKVLAKLEASGPNSFMQMIENMTGDPDFALKFITNTKFQIRNAWKQEGGKWVNPFNSIPTDSILEELMEGARRKICPDGYNAYLVAYLGKNPRCQLLVDYKGLCDTALAEKICLDIGAKEVCENDDIELDFGEVSRFKIDPKSPRGNVIGCVAWAILPSGRRKSVYLDFDELKQIEGCAQTNEVWGPWAREMYKKSAIRRLFKTMQNTPRMQAMCELDNRSFDMKKARAIPRAAKQSPVRSIAGDIPASLPAPVAPADPAAETPAEVVEAEPVFS